VTAARIPLRCAIYTRRSSDEGLSQTFNSLHAQREACEAYVRSQLSEGWTLVRDHYDDVGYSGGSMDRPALRRLLADVSSGRVQIVVVYKVDRLTRFLPDFARIIETFEARGVSFVSVTQAFNTTSSMGRLTLNVLLSFAQFERDITGERIRDKIAASKAKGMWMGGNVPLGYDRPSDHASRALAINPHEAKTVRVIFERFLALGSLSALQQWLLDEGIRPKRSMPQPGRTAGSVTFSCGALRYLLKNRVYLGETIHKELVHPGRHEAIVDLQTFEAAQALLGGNSRRRRDHKSRADRMLLRNLLFDGDGQVMAPVFGSGKNRSYSYYASPPVRLGDGQDDALRRVPSDAIDALVVRHVATLTGDVDETPASSGIRSVLARVEIHAAAVHLVFRLRELADLTGSRETLETIRSRLGPGCQVVGEPTSTRLARVMLPIRLKTRGGRAWAISPEGRPFESAPMLDADLVGRLREGHAILRACNFHQETPADELQRGRAPKRSRDARTARWAFLAPDIQRAILTGANLPGAAHVLKNHVEIPISWAAQRVVFELNASARGVPEGSESV
jgi:DNA invertase Pin-like site-specific DNA recombinase